MHYKEQNMNKYITKKTRCPKNYTLSEIEVSILAGCSVSYVKKLRANTVNTKSRKAQQILAIDQIANDGKSLLIKEIERIVKI